MRIRSSVIVLFVQRMNSIQNTRMAKAARRVTSGSRINSAADDPAGFSISEKLRARIRGMSVSVRNSENAVSLVQPAVAVQASGANDDTTDRKALDAKYRQVVEELGDIATKTRYNGRVLLDGSLDDGQAGAFFYSEDYLAGGSGETTGYANMGGLRCP